MNIFYRLHAQIPELNLAITRQTLSFNTMVFCICRQIQFILLKYAQQYHVFGLCDHFQA